MLDASRSAVRRALISVLQAIGSVGFQVPASADVECLNEIACCPDHGTLLEQTKPPPATLDSGHGSRLTAPQAQRLREAGLDFYNHNVDTSPEFYGSRLTYVLRSVAHNKRPSRSVLEI